MEISFSFQIFLPSLECLFWECLNPTLALHKVILSLQQRFHHRWYYKDPQSLLYRKTLLDTEQKHFLAKTCLSYCFDRCDGSSARNECSRVKTLYFYWQIFLAILSSKFDGSFIGFGSWISKKDTNIKTCKFIDFF